MIDPICDVVSCSLLAKMCLVSQNVTDVSAASFLASVALAFYEIHA